MAYLFPIANIIPQRTKLNAKYTKVLRNSGVVVEEDLSRAAKNRRRELEKFVKEIKAIDGNKKCVIKYETTFLRLTPHEIT